MFKAKVNKVHAATELRHSSLRERLLDAADTAIAHGGLGELKARDLAGKAGCAVGAIYKVFADMDELILHVSARTLAALDTHLHEAAGRHPDAEPTARLVLLAEAYLNYAAANRQRWDALFSYRLATGRVAPDWFLELQAALFAQVEGPLAALRPALPAKARTLVARTVFSAVHGIVSLGLDQRVANIDDRGLKKQLRFVVTALATGLTQIPVSASSRDRY